LTKHTTERYNLGRWQRRIHTLSHSRACA
jgi:hypothetical protein